MASVLKKINNNTVLVEDGGIEKIVVGKGVGFRAVPCRIFDMKSADKIYVLDLEEERKRFMQTKESKSHVIRQYI